MSNQAKGKKGGGSPFFFSLIFLQLYACYIEKNVLVKIKVILDFHAMLLFTEVTTKPEGELGHRRNIFSLASRTTEKMLWFNFTASYYLVKFSFALKYIKDR